MHFQAIFFTWIALVCTIQLNAAFSLHPHSSPRYDFKMRNGGPREQDDAWQRERENLRDYLAQLKQEMNEQQFSAENEGVDCPGEPSVDPSRSIDPNRGDSEWVDDW